MLNQKICFACEHHTPYENLVNPDYFSVKRNRRDKLWEDGGKCICDFGKMTSVNCCEKKADGWHLSEFHAELVDVNGMPPDECPMKLEHVVS